MALFFSVTQRGNLQILDFIHNQFYNIDHRWKKLALNGKNVTVNLMQNLIDLFFHLKSQKVYPLDYKTN